MKLFLFFVIYILFYIMMDSPVAGIFSMILEDTVPSLVCQTPEMISAERLSIYRGKRLSIVQTFKSRITLNMRLQLDNWRRQRGYNYFYADDDACVKFFENECSLGRVRLLYGLMRKEALETSKFRASMADVFRFAYLYEYGGVYADVDLVPYVDLDKFINDEDDLVLPLGHILWDMKYVNMYFIYCKSRRHELFKAALDGICDRLLDGNKKSRWWQDNPIYDVFKVTGPEFLTGVFKSLGGIARPFETGILADKKYRIIPTESVYFFSSPLNAKYRGHACDFAAARKINAS
jgi:hypothetical protein